MHKKRTTTLFLSLPHWQKVRISAGIISAEISELRKTSKCQQRSPNKPAGRHTMQTSMGHGLARNSALPGSHAGLPQERGRAGHQGWPCAGWSLTEGGSPKGLNVGCTAGKRVLWWHRKGQASTRVPGQKQTGPEPGLQHGAKGVQPRDRAGDRPTNNPVQKQARALGWPEIGSQAHGLGGEPR